MKPGAITGPASAAGVERTGCGDCSLCCKLIGVAALDKPRCTWCRHIAPNRRGCSIYQDRPGECRDFRCLWLRSHEDRAATPLPMALRPDRAHVVFVLASGDGGAVVAHVDPAYPHAWREGAPERLIGDLVGKGAEVLVTVGRERKLLKRHSPP